GGRDQRGGGGGDEGFRDHRGVSWWVGRSAYGWIVVVETMWGSFSMRHGQRRPSLPSISATCRPPIRGRGRPPPVPATATTISSARGASTTRASIASKWLRT